MSDFLKKEYKTHIIHNSYPMFLYWIAFVLLTALALGAFGVNTARRSECVEAKMGLGYSYAVETESSYAEYSSHYKLNNPVGTSNSKGKLAYTNFYVELSDGSGFSLCEYKLSPDGIAISSKLADRLGVGTGDEIVADISIWDSGKSYTVEAILPYLDDYYGFEDSYGLSVAVVAADQRIVDNASGRFVAFLTDSEHEAFMDDECGYLNRYYASAEMEIAKRNCDILNLVWLVSAAAVFVAYSVFIGKTMRVEQRKYFIEGLSERDLRMLITADRAVFCVSALWTVTVVFWVMAALRLMLVTSVWAVTFGTAIISAVVLFRGTGYERMH